MSQPIADALRFRLDEGLAGSYTIERELGGGGMSRVFLATEVALAREVVIKVLPPDMALGVSAERFRREMQTVARLQHPHIVPVLSTGAVGDLLYYVMPFIKGESLRSRLTRQSTMPIEESARILREVADALGFAHAQGIVHRDIKPDNVLLSGDHALVTDFGVAKALGVGVAADPAGGGLTSVGMALGTPVYMAPEQAMADPQLDHRADLYALGVMAYEMLAGEAPFTGSSPQALIAAHIAREPAPLRTRRTSVPESLEALVMQCLAKQPADRIQHAAALLPVLDAIAHRTSHGTLAAAAPPKPARGEPLIVMAAGFVVLVAAAWGLRQWLGLPDRLVVAAVGLVVLAVPIVHRLRHPQMATTGALVGHATSSRGMATAGLIAVLGLGSVAGAFLGLRAAGIGPFATLLSAGRLAERDRIIVAEFMNSTPDTTLGVALTEALTIDLSQSRVVRLMSPADIRDGLARMQRDAKTHLLPEVATELAEREGAKLVVAGDVAPFASGYALSARLLDAQGATLYATRATANSTADILPALDKVSHALREAIGESLQSIRSTQSLEQVSTSSLEALQLYSRAIRSQRAGADDDRTALFRQAVALDSSFAMAWRGIYADLNNLRGDPAQRVDAIERVYRFKDRLPAHEALLAEALYASFLGNREQAVEIYRRIVASWPEDMQAQNGVGLFLRALGRYAESEQQLAPLVEAGTATASMHYNLVTTQIPQRKFAEARHTLALMTQRLPKSPLRWQATYFLASSTNAFDTAMVYADSLTRSSNAGLRYWGHLYQAEVSLLRGQIAAGQRSTRAAQTAQLDQRNPGGALREGLWAIYIDLQQRGDSAAARSALAAVLDATPLDSLPLASRPWGDVVRLQAALGLLDAARRTVAEYERLMPKVLQRDDPQVARGRAQLALAEGRFREAITLARAGASGSEGSTADLVGAAFERLGMPDSAVVGYEQALRPPTYGSDFQNWRPAVVPRAMFRLGELYERQGQRQLARDRYSAFADLWEKADASLQPAVALARTRLRALGTER